MLTQNLPNSVAAAIIAENDRLRRASVEILLETAALQEKLGSEPALGRIGSGANGWAGQPLVPVFQTAAINSGVTRRAV